MPTNALLVIDIQNDYFPNGAFPLHNAEKACQAALPLIMQAKSAGWLVVGIQHLNSRDAAFFAADTPGAELHPKIAAALGDAPIITKHQADSFFATELAPLLEHHGVQNVYLLGMMTQHCITHTALSKQLPGQAFIYANACAAPSQFLHDLAIRGLSAHCRVA